MRSRPDRVSGTPHTSPSAASKSAASTEPPPLAPLPVSSQRVFHDTGTPSIVSGPTSGRRADRRTGSPRLPCSLGRAGSVPQASIDRVVYDHISPFTRPPYASAECERRQASSGVARMRLWIGTESHAQDAEIMESRFDCPRGCHCARLYGCCGRWGGLSVDAAFRDGHHGHARMEAAAGSDRLPVPAKRRRRGAHARPVDDHGEVLEGVELCRAGSPAR